MKEFGETDQQTTQLARVSMTDGVGHGRRRRRRQQQQQPVERTSLRAIRTRSHINFVMRSHCGNMSAFRTLTLRSSSAWWCCVLVSSNYQLDVLYERRPATSAARSILITDVTIIQAISTNAIKLTSAARGSEELDRRICFHSP